MIINKESAMKKTFRIAIATVLLGYCQSVVLAADIVEAATTAGTFKTFVAALKTAGFNEILEKSGPYTIFAPTDEAFAKIPKDTWTKISKDKTRLEHVLAYHVIPGKILVKEVKPGKAKTMEGDTLTLTSDNGKVTVNGANVTQSDIETDQGVMHAIDSVVLPPS